MIKFSVVIPLFNKEKEIQHTLKSVLNQTYKPDEVIVVDDGSTDRSVEIVQREFKNSVKLIRQENLGVSAARNRGIKESKNKYICFIDADDLWKENFLEEIKNLINDFPDAVVYSTSHKMIDENGKTIKSKVNLNKDFRGYLDNFIKIFKDNYGLINSSSVCIKKSVNPLFPVGEKRGEDLCLWIELSLKGKFAFVNKTLSIYKLNANNRSGTIHKDIIIPCHLKWIYNNNTKKDIINLVHKNILIQTYGWALEGRKKDIKAVINYMKKNHDIFYFLIIPALFMPIFILNFIKKLRRKRR